MAIRAILIREEPTERRRGERWRVRFEARRLDHGPAAQLTILDLSSSGFLLKTEQAFRAGTCLIVEMPGDVTKICKTVWSNGNLYGATFAEPLSDAELQHLTRSGSVAWPSLEVGPDATSITQFADRSKELTGHPDIDEDERLPGALRLLIIVGASAALWAVIGFALWVSFA